LSPAGPFGLTSDLVGEREQRSPIGRLDLLQDDDDVLTHHDGLSTRLEPEFPTGFLWNADLAFF